MEWIIENAVAQNVPQGEPFICLFSSGKDSVLALSIACAGGAIPVSLIYCDSEEDVLNHDYTFHRQTLKNVRMQAERMGIPLEHHKGLWYKWPSTAKVFCGVVRYVVFGDLHLDDNLRIQRRLCEKLGMIPCFPLWNKEYDVLMDELERYNITTIITAIDPSSYITSNWLGKKFERNTYNSFCGLLIDSFGENGEYHTFVVDCSLFNRELEYRLEKQKNQYAFIDVW